MVKFLFLALFAILVIAEASPKGRSGEDPDVPHYGSLDVEWAKFKKKFNRHYRGPVEEAKRKAIFAKTLQRVKAQNERYERGESTFIAGINDMGELLWYPPNSLSNSSLKLTSFFILFLLTADWTDDEINRILAGRNGEIPDIVIYRSGILGKKLTI